MSTIHRIPDQHVFACVQGGIIGGCSYEGHVCLNRAGHAGDLKCPLGYRYPVWLECDDYLTTAVGQKLTMAVFDRVDCPEDAMFAAVDASGKAFWYTEEEEPVKRRSQWVGKHSNKGTMPITGIFSPLDWENSLLRRIPKAAITWVKSGEYCSQRDADRVLLGNSLPGHTYYYRIIAVSADSVKLEPVGTSNGVKRCCTLKQAMEGYTYRSVRNWTPDEMKQQIGRPFRNVITGKLLLCVDVLADGNTLHLGTLSHGYSADMMRQVYEHIDGMPCGVLEMASTIHNQQVTTRNRQPEGSQR